MNVKEALNDSTLIIIDTRTQKEYELDHLPNAINIPILNNEERAIVGALYQENKEKAIELGYEYYNKNIPKITKELSSFKDKKIVIYCARGGMRSKTITKFAVTLGLNAHQLLGGYKYYRAYIRDFFDNYQSKFEFIVLYGLAGCGKTELIKKITPSIDLEGLAGHRSSLFGAIGLNPVNQKKFETLLYSQLKRYEKEKYIFIEGESSKVGRVFIPKSVFKIMNKGIGIEVTRSLEKRSEQIVKDYFTHNEDEKIKEIIILLNRSLSNKIVDNLVELLKQKNYMKVSEILLTDYYDLKYNFQNKEIGYRYKINNDNLDKATRELMAVLKD